MSLAARWIVVVPIKDLTQAKTRLSDFAPQRRADLALAMAMDVVAAALTAAPVSGVLVVTNDPRAAGTLSDLGASVIADATDSGLNDALMVGARSARAMWPRCGVAAVASDLPCATGAAIERVLGRAAGPARSVLADRSGDGTTLLTARPGVDLSPRYGADSRTRHVQTGATLLDPAGLDELALDVDTPEDLADALARGVGPRTAAVMLHAGHR